MVNMDDLFGDRWREDFSAIEAVGDITLRSHPEFPELAIANYTPKAAYDGAWNKITLASRGLIFNAKTGEVLARPFKKFFNYGQAGAPEIPLSSLLYHVGNKYDGSLGIMYIRPDNKLAVATRGSFSSVQAQHATALVQDPETSVSYPWDYFRGDIKIGLTPLFEIIYPENRIVLDYGDEDRLALLGWVDMRTGKYTPPQAEPFATTFGAVLDRPARKNAEGWVVWLDGYTAVKIKQEDYVALHKVVTGLNEKAVWAALATGYPQFLDFLANLPDELQPWAKNVGNDLGQQYAVIIRDIDEWYLRAVETAWDYSESSIVIPRKNLALAVQDEVPPEYRGFMFSLADGKDISEKVWKLIEPKGGGSRPSSTLGSADDE